MILRSMISVIVLFPNVFIQALTVIRSRHAYRYLRQLEYGVDPLAVPFSFYQSICMLPGV